MVSPSQKFLLGVEGGGTKSFAILADEKGKTAGERKGEALNWRAVGELGAKNNIVKLIGPLLRKAQAGKVYAVFGLAGLDTKKDKAVYMRIIRSVLPKNSVFQIMNDADIALEAVCSNEKNRVLVISGTGSTVHGERDGKKVQSMSWDFLLSDEGSGYMAGLKTIKMGVRSWDGRSKKTVLEDLVLKRSGAKTMEDLIHTLYKNFYGKRESIKRYIASFAPLVDDAILQNDWAGIEIRKETAQDLLEGVRAVVLRLGMEKDGFCIGRVGSMWKMPGLQELFVQKVTEQFPDATFSEKKDPPVRGAIALAKKLIQEGV